MIILFNERIKQKYFTQLLNILRMKKYEPLHSKSSSNGIFENNFPSKIFHSELIMLGIYKVLG